MFHEEAPRALPPFSAALDPAGHPIPPGLLLLVWQRQAGVSHWEAGPPPRQAKHCIFLIHLPRGSQSPCRDPRGLTSVTHRPPVTQELLGVGAGISLCQGQAEEAGGPQHSPCVPGEGTVSHHSGKKGDSDGGGQPGMQVQPAPRTWGSGHWRPEGPGDENRGPPWPGLPGDLAQAYLPACYAARAAAVPAVAHADQQPWGPHLCFSPLDCVSPGGRRAGHSAWSEFSPHSTGPPGMDGTGPPSTRLRMTR